MKLFRFLLVFLVFAFASQNSFAQADVSEKDEIYTVLDHQPEFPGGTMAMYRYLAENIKYPSSARGNRVTGKVMVKFVVEKDGSIDKVIVLKSLESACDQEAIRLVKSMPKWNPGSVNGIKKRAYFQIPIIFKP
jgi:periplasmic protein TonB